MTITSRRACCIRFRIFLHLAWIPFDLEGDVFDLGLAACDLERIIGDRGWFGTTLATYLALVINRFLIRGVADLGGVVLHLGGPVLDLGGAVLGFGIHSSSEFLLEVEFRRTPVQRKKLKTAVRFSNFQFRSSSDKLVPRCAPGSILSTIITRSIRGSIIGSIGTIPRQTFGVLGTIP